MTSNTALIEKLMKRVNKLRSGSNNQAAPPRKRDFDSIASSTDDDDDDHAAKKQLEEENVSRFQSNSALEISELPSTPNLADSHTFLDLSQQDNGIADVIAPVPYIEKRASSMSPMESANGSTAAGTITTSVTESVAEEETLDVPSNRDERVKFIKDMNANLKIVAAHNRVGKVIAAKDAALSIRRHQLLRAYLSWMESDLDIDSDLAKRTNMELCLGLLFKDPKITCPEDFKTIGKSLHDKWEAENWGEDIVPDEGNESEEEQEPPQKPFDGLRASSTRNLISQYNTDATIRYPPKGHRIWGENGIMDGVVEKRGPSGYKTYILDRRVSQKSAKVFGHNGIPVGVWYPTQLVALQRGAHGSRVGGIAGSVATGAYSIVTSAHYDDLDEDKGETLYFSGSNSHENDDPSKPLPSSKATKALKASRSSGKPVRVLRSGGSTYSDNPKSKSSSYLPSCGLRYDGLYRVVEMRIEMNNKNGAYERFKLERLPNQVSLEEIRRESPTYQQIKDLQDSKVGY
ncbi:PUA-like domain-containing protein [Calycina marina]|uniref:PUA-like domain-containing protein n=1 Tax=Calycina marina TaxID=1763456 RepID=A0A9P7Z688_9HELO|nr:PUA-like domain-containing protein [Calycina marina]